MAGVRGGKDRDTVDRGNEAELGSPGGVDDFLVRAAAAQDLIDAVEVFAGDFPGRVQVARFEQVFVQQRRGKRGAQKDERGDTYDRGKDKALEGTEKADEFVSHMVRGLIRYRH